MNPLYQMMMGQSPMNDIMRRLQQFRSSFSGNAQQQVQQMLNSGRISQAEYNEAVQKANQLFNMIGGR